MICSEICSDGDISVLAETGLSAYFHTNKLHVPGTFSGTEDKRKRSSCFILYNFFLPCADHKLQAGKSPLLVTLLYSQPDDGFPQGCLPVLLHKQPHALPCYVPYRDHSAHEAVVSNQLQDMVLQRNKASALKIIWCRQQLSYVYTPYITALYSVRFSLFS